MKFFNKFGEKYNMKENYNFKAFNPSFETRIHLSTYLCVMTIKNLFDRCRIRTSIRNIGVKTRNYRFTRYLGTVYKSSGLIYDRIGKGKIGNGG